MINKLFQAIKQLFADPAPVEQPVRVAPRFEEPVAPVAAPTPPAPVQEKPAAAKKPRRPRKKKTAAKPTE